MRAYAASPDIRAFPRILSLILECLTPTDNDSIISVADISATDIYRI